MMGVRTTKLGISNLENHWALASKHLKAAMAEAFKERFNPFTESDNENDPDMVIDLDSKQDEDVDIE